jgi:thiosulfate/3-mercaptopyruvate sulfurtransferase
MRIYLNPIMGVKDFVMEFSTLISVEGLAQYLHRPDWVIVDCRFSLAETHKGKLDYEEAHIPGAVYAHLDDDLSGQVVPGQTGRHPLPDVTVFVERLGEWGIGNHTQVVVYDDSGGMIAVRLWWMLRWLGHEKVAVLDGGYPAWTAAGNPVDANVPMNTAQQFTPDIRPEMLITADGVLLNFGDPGKKLVDSRAVERYSGEQEPIDAVAGRIPGAENYFWGANLDAKGHMHLKQVLRGRFESLFGDIAAEDVTFYCGSGVTAAHNILAVAHAGLGMPAMYAGSWSEWITDPERPIVTG